MKTIDDQGRTRRFGNMTLSRLPVLQIRNHLLPWPEAGSVLVDGGDAPWRRPCKRRLAPCLGDSYIEYGGWFGLTPGPIDAIARYSTGGLDQPKAGPHEPR